ncbi:DUF6615 family protein [Coleofasciculus sp. FACHB-SPT9]|uniref:DUF6615 family protein n=1 Tax=Cyanophyceae TaxID=3028117 RepID=UPI00168811EE|nr:DUF6615 family protein [Coleofasciculus sp. FACHB-SPT9]MBD1890486.1 hypothetical protein [Coleofasciculus sp. FACHB-SPT9]
MAISASQIFEQLAKAVWERIQLGENLGCRQGEETITDINILDLKRAGICEVSIPKINKATESETGIDWEWWIGSDQKGWWRYAVQAKKIQTKKGNKDQIYSKLRHKVGKSPTSQFQIDILETYAQGHNCIPLYCLYNFIDDNNLQQYWRCCNLTYDKFQFGCTVVPIDVIRKALNTRGKKTFQSVHSHKSALPWRCLVTCPFILSIPQSGLHPLANGIYANVYSYDTLSSLKKQKAEEEKAEEEARKKAREKAREGNITDLSNDFYDRQLEFYPKRTLIVNVDDEA